MRFAKFVKRLTKNIKYNYACHGVHIKLELKRYYPGYKHFIYRVMFKPGSKVDIFFSRSKDVGITLQVPLFRPFIENTQLYLAVSFQSDIPNDLASLLYSKEFRNGSEQLPVVIGRDLLLRPVVADVADMPHAFLAGSTNSGKSVGLCTMITSLISCRSVEDLNLLIFDIGSDSLEPFYDIPHLSYPVVKDMETPAYVLRSLFREMERRYSLRESERSKLPFIVCVFDEFVSFMDELKAIDKDEEIRKCISNLLRRGRKAKIHLILTAQDPKKGSLGVDIGNATTRMAFRCAKFQTSVNIINQGGAETLSSKGSMLYVSAEHPNPLYVQGAFMPPEQIQALVEKVSEEDYNMEQKFTIPGLSDSVVSMEAVSDNHGSESVMTNVSMSETDVLLAQSVFFALQQDKLSGEDIKAEFKIGQNGAGGTRAIMKQLTDWKIVSEPHGKLPRTVLIKELTGLPFEALKLLNDAKLITQEKFAQVLEEQKRLASVTGVNDEIASDDDVGTVMESDS